MPITAATSAHHHDQLQLQREREEQQRRQRPLEGARVSNKAKEYAAFVRALQTGEKPVTARFHDPSTHHQTQQQQQQFGSNSAAAGLDDDSPPVSPIKKSVGFSDAGFTCRRI